MSQNCTFRDIDVAVSVPLNASLHFDGSAVTRLENRENRDIDVVVPSAEMQQNRTRCSTVMRTERSFISATSTVYLLVSRQILTRE